MLDIGWTELLVIAVVAIIVVGPKDLPGMLRSLGQYAGKLKRTAGEFRSQFDEALRESEFDDIRSSVQDMSDLNPVGQIKDAVNESLDPLKSTAEEIRSGIESEPGIASEASDAGASREGATDEPAIEDDPGMVEDSDAGEAGQVAASADAPVSENARAATPAKSDG